MAQNYLIFCGKHTNLYVIYFQERKTEYQTPSSGLFHVLQMVCNCKFRSSFVPDLLNLHRWSQLCEHELFFGPIHFKDTLVKFPVSYQIHIPAFLTSSMYLPGL